MRYSPQAPQCTDPFQDLAAITGPSGAAGDHDVPLVVDLATPVVPLRQQGQRRLAPGRAHQRDRLGGAQPGAGRPPALDQHAAAHRARAGRPRRAAPRPGRASPTARGGTAPRRTTPGASGGDAASPTTKRDGRRPPAVALARARRTISGEKSTPSHAVTGLGQQHRQRAGAAAEVRDPARRRRQPGEQQLAPGRADVRVAQPVVGGLVEVRRRGVPRARCRLVASCAKPRTVHRRPTYADAHVPAPAPAGCPRPCPRWRWRPCWPSCSAPRRPRPRRSRTTRPTSRRRSAGRRPSRAPRCSASWLVATYGGALRRHLARLRQRRHVGAPGGSRLRLDAGRREAGGPAPREGLPGRRARRPTGTATPTPGRAGWASCTSSGTTGCTPPGTSSSPRTTSARAARTATCSTTLRHRDHLHVSLTRPAGRGETSWYAGRLR